MVCGDACRSFSALEALRARCVSSAPSGVALSGADRIDGAGARLDWLAERGLERPQRRVVGAHDPQSVAACDPLPLCRGDGGVALALGGGVLEDEGVA
jgi:hypothetical protein